MDDSDPQTVRHTANFALPSPLVASAVFTRKIPWRFE
jgi:hypothetical protein